MRVRFYGVRGSIATAGDETRRYGGNTPCVTVEAGDELLIFDAGTGIRKLGTELGPVGVRASLFFSHLHWDHIQGFPFFTPAFVPGNELSIYGVSNADDGASVRDLLAAQMRPPHFPVTLDVMAADLRFHDLAPHALVRRGPLEVRHAPVDHPNGCVAWRVDYRGRSVVYATDLEHDGHGPAPALLELAAGADLLIYDAMYTPEEYEGDAIRRSRRGWGHSTFEAGAQLAERARAKELCLFHHDPAHGDVFMDELG
ncbi:MAG: MBL fold metallo-hydrolase, partial [Myxococcota bacterium]